MKEYIERQIAENKLGEAMPKLETPDGRGENDYEREIAQESFVDAIGVIHNLPSADVVEVVHGRWEYNRDATDWGIGGYVCSECKNKNNNLPCSRVKSPKLFSGARYCPNCGAKMDLEE